MCRAGLRVGLTVSLKICAVDESLNSCLTGVSFGRSLLLMTTTTTTTTHEFHRCPHCNHVILETADWSDWNHISDNDECPYCGHELRAEDVVKVSAAVARDARGRFTA